jgi:hypothetical protein
LAPAGYYLFNVKNAGTPSAAVWIHIGWKNKTKKNQRKTQKFTHIIIMWSISFTHFSANSPLFYF